MTEQVINLLERRPALNREAFKAIFATAVQLQLDLRHSNKMMEEAEKIMWTADHYSKDKKQPPIIDTLEKAKGYISGALQKIGQLMQQEVNTQYCLVVTEKIDLIRNKLASIL